MMYDLPLSFSKERKSQLEVKICRVIKNKYYFRKKVFKGKSNWHEYLVDDVGDPR